MTTLAEQLYKNCPLEIVSHILYFDKWETPKDFLDISKKERKELMKKYRPHSVHATASNYWIWFGQYSTQRYMPVYNRLSVPRVLFEGVISPLPPGPLRSTFTETKADVNPHKYFQSKNKMAALYVLGGPEGAKQVLETNQSKAVEEMNLQINECVAKIDEFFMPHMNDTYEFMTVVMRHEGYPELVIRSALERSTKPFKDKTNG